MKNAAIVVTTINPPTAGMIKLRDGAKKTEMKLIIIGDEKSPKEYDLKDTRFLNVRDQRSIESVYARIAPTKSYARKNIGYLIAMQSGAPVIIETDDDNIPQAPFFAKRVLHHKPNLVVHSTGWVNAYSYFGPDSDNMEPRTVWPRGLPLTHIHSVPQAEVPNYGFHCPVQQGLANDDPDVDAIWRLINPDGLRFAPGPRRVVLNGGVCPINSQNTTWFPEVYPLMYLPATCSFRMTDIWRGFVAQRIMNSNHQYVLFHQPTVRQKRNEHDLMKDFTDEIEGYKHNEEIRRHLWTLPLEPGAGRAVRDNLRKCYQMLVNRGFLGQHEMDLLNAWLVDIAEISP